MTLIRIVLIIGLIGAYPLFGMKFAYKTDTSSRFKSQNYKNGEKSQTALNQAELAMRVVGVAVTSRDPYLYSVPIRTMPNPREFAVIALRISAPEVQEKAVNDLLQTPQARQAFLHDIRNKDGSYVVNKLGQVDFLVEHSNKRRFGLAADNEEKASLEDRIAKSQRLLKASSSQESFFFISDDQRALMRRLYKHFDPATSGAENKSINLSGKEWQDLHGIPTDARTEFRTKEKYLKAHRMPTAEDKVTHVAKNVARRTLIGAVPGAFGGWLVQTGQEVGNVVLSDQMKNTVTDCIGDTAHNTMKNALQSAGQLTYEFATPKAQALDELSRAIVTFGATFPANAQNDLSFTFTQKGPGIIGDAAVSALNHPGNILSGTSMGVFAGAGAAYGLVEGVATMHKPIDKKNISEV